MKWKDRIARAKEFGKFADDERWLAADWNKCACCSSEHEFSFKRKVSRLSACRGVPEDPELRNLGLMFAFAVDDNEVDKAEEIYNKIHSRVKELEKLANS